MTRRVSHSIERLAVEIVIKYRRMKLLFPLEDTMERNVIQNLSIAFFNLRAPLANQGNRLYTIELNFLIRSLLEAGAFFPPNVENFLRLVDNESTRVCH